VTIAGLVLAALLLCACNKSTTSVSQPAASIAPAVSHQVTSGPASLATDLASPTDGRLAGGVPTVASVIGVEDGETFAPAPLSAVPKLTARRALDAEERQDHPGARRFRKSHLRPGVHVRVGILNFPPRIRHELVYALIYGPEGCLNTSLNPPKDTGTCVSWSFLSARTGRLVDGAQQRMPGARNLRRQLAPNGRRLAS
jgi:hypothetical protein